MRRIFITAEMLTPMVHHFSFREMLMIMPNPAPAKRRKTTTARSLSKRTEGA